tara:strand:- start:3115 stop:4323 length:1209 start_codon:yes stop_codon:yes gene_type:complete
MKILIISFHTCPVNKLGQKDTGGLNLYVHQLSEQLGERNNSVDIFTRKHDVTDPIKIDINKNSQLIHFDAGDLDQTKNEMVDHITLFTDNVTEYIKKHSIEYDLIYSNYWMSGIIGSKLSQFLSIPHIISFHTMGKTKRTANHMENESDYRISQEIDLIKKSDAIIVPSLQERENLEQNYIHNNNIYTVSPGVDLNQFQKLDKKKSRNKLGIDQNTHILLSVGRLEPLKGYDLLIESLAYINLDNINFQLIIIGGDDRSNLELERLTRIAKENDVHDKVSFIGAVDHDILPLYFSASDIFTMPSAYETFGIAALEASACGLPVIAPQVGGLKSIVKHGFTGYLTTSRCPELFVHYLEILLKNKQLRDVFGINSRKQALNFSWEKSTEDLIKVFEKILNKTPA